jgi:hypothetical protein
VGTAQREDSTVVPAQRERRRNCESAVTSENPQDEPPRPVTPDAVDTVNPLEGLGLNVFVPDIEVRLVHAGALEEYELWFGLASILAASAVGFMVAYIQSFGEKDIHGTAHPDKTFLVVTILFFVLFVGVATRAGFLRWRIKKKSSSYQMRVTSV